MNPWNMEIERRLALLEDKLAGQKPLTFAVDECNNIPCNAAEEVLKGKIERLIAYFERHSRENQKRSEKEENRRVTTIMPVRASAQNERSSYYFSGKADTYERAAEKVREVLGEPKLAAYPMYTPTAEESKVWKDNPKWTEPMFKNPAEKWIVESKSSSGDYRRSLDVPEEFSSETAALTAIAEVERRFTAGTKRRARRIDVLAPEKWVIDMRCKGYPNDPWGPSGDPDVCGEFPSKAAAEEAIAHNGAVTVERRARRID